MSLEWIDQFVTEGDAMYEYQATVDVVDGDTVKAAVDLGFSVRLETPLRLLGINAPEVHGPTQEAGLAAAEHLRQLLRDHTGGTNRVTLHTVKDRRDKYGRYLATLIASGIDLNRQMVADGHAVEFMLPQVRAD